MGGAVMPVRPHAAGRGRADRMAAWRDLACLGAAWPALAFLALACLAACDHASGPSAEPPATASAVLKGIAADVIYPTYVDLAERADSLAAAVDRLAEAPDSGRLEAARKAWRAARSPWEK